MKAVAYSSPFEESGMKAVTHSATPESGGTKTVTHSGTLVSSGGTKAVTHSGTFHADDVFAFAVLRAALGAVGLVRSRDPAVIEEADIVFDVGGLYEPGRRRYDHHMRDRPLRPDGETPYSSVGLIWRDYGPAALRAWLPDLDEAAAASVWADLDAGLILEIDRADNGIATVATGHLSQVAEAFNPVWDEARSEDSAFLEAADFAAGVLIRAARQAAAEARAVALVLAAARASEDPRVLVLDCKLPWEKAVFEHGLDRVLFAVYPNDEGTNWYCRTVPPEPGSFGQRLPLPAAWGGLRDEAFAQAAGVADGVFCHPSLFICAARSRAAVLELARRAITAAGA
ncbi:MAG TPA: MYG1 family protein [Microvirga sp.]|jgi:uncharacterized UPF0160 family protein|nr:MYG1 family protein [Microvirga sp.]